MSDHDAVRVAAFKQLIYSFGQFQPNFVSHVIWADVSDLLAFDVSDILYLRDGFYEDIDPELPGVVLGVRRACRTSRDRAAGCQYDDVWLCDKRSNEN